MALAAGKPVYARGDFNVNMLSADSADTVHFNSLLRDFNMSQLISEPTHPHPVPSLLDLAVTNVPSADIHVSVLPDIVADHLPIVVRPPAFHVRRPPTTICSRPWNCVDWDAFSADILNADWGLFYAADDVNSKLAIFTRIWDVTADVHAPVKRMTLQRPTCPWLRDEEVREVMAERDAARRAWAASRSVVDRNEYKRLRNLSKLVLSRARRSHLTESLYTDARRFWSRLKQYGADFSATGSKNAPPPDQDALSPDQLNQHFAGVGARVAAEASQAARDAGACDTGPRPYRVCADAFVTEGW